MHSIWKSWLFIFKRTVLLHLSTCIEFKLYVESKELYMELYSGGIVSGYRTEGEREGGGNVERWLGKKNNIESDYLHKIRYLVHEWKRMHFFIRTLSTPWNRCKCRYTAFVNSSGGGIIECCVDLSVFGAQACPSSAVVATLCSCKDERSWTAGREKL